MSKINVITTSAFRCVQLDTPVLKNHQGYEPLIQYSIQLKRNSSEIGLISKVDREPQYKSFGDYVTESYSSMWAGDSSTLSEGFKDVCEGHSEHVKGLEEALEDSKKCTKDLIKEIEEGDTYV